MPRRAPPPSGVGALAAFAVRVVSTHGKKGGKKVRDPRATEGRMLDEPDDPGTWRQQLITDDVSLGTGSVASSRLRDAAHPGKRTALLPPHVRRG